MKVFWSFRPSFCLELGFVVVFFFLFSIPKIPLELLKSDRPCRVVTRPNSPSLSEVDPGW